MTPGEERKGEGELNIYESGSMGLVESAGPKGERERDVGHE